jgi:hypothetical protein
MSMEKIDYAAVLSRKMLQMFPDPGTCAIAYEELARYGQEEYEREPDRVRVAILKLAGASLDGIGQWVGIAKNDYRDVLASAEYPNQLVAPTWEMAGDRCRQIQLEDARQYEEWIGLK